VPTTSLLNPDTHQAFSGTSAVSSELHSTATTVGLYAVDTLSLGEQWDVSGGFRWDRFDAEVANAVTKRVFNRVDEMPSWRGALVYKPAKHGSVYFAYGTSFNPSAESLALTAGNANLPPEENESFELGSKWDLFAGRLTTRGALFRTEKSNARETNPANANEVVLAGQQRVQGVELEVSGKVVDRWRIAAGYAFMESEVLSSRFFPASVGYPLANVPRHTFSLWNTWELPRGFEAGAGIRYVASRTASSTVPLDPVTLRLKEVPGYWTLDAMLKYRVSQNLDLQVNVYNLTDRDYIDQIHPGHLVPGAGVSALFSAHLHF
jgi:catecholate siderophore receptor